MVCQTGGPIENHLKSGLRSKLRQMVGPTDGTMKPFIDNLTKRDRDKNQKKMETRLLHGYEEVQQRPVP